MSGVIHWWDSHHQQLAQLDIDELDKQLKSISGVLNKYAENLEHVGPLHLDEIDVSLDIKGNVLVVALDGAIKLVFKGPSSNPKQGT